MTKPQPIGLQTELCLRIDHGWTPEQAMAVFDLITDLRERIWSHDGLVLQEQYRPDGFDDGPYGDEHLEGDPDMPFWTTRYNGHFTNDQGQQTLPLIPSNTAQLHFSLNTVK